MATKWHQTNQMARNNETPATATTTTTQNIHHKHHRSQITLKIRSSLQHKSQAHRHIVAPTIVTCDQFQIASAHNCELTTDIRNQRINSRDRAYRSNINFDDLDDDREPYYQQPTDKFQFIGRPAHHQRGSGRRNHIVNPFGRHPHAR